MDPYWFVIRERNPKKRSLLIEAIEALPERVISGIKNRGDVDAILQADGTVQIGNYDPFASRVVFNFPENAKDPKTSGNVGSFTYNGTRYLLVAI